METDIANVARRKVLAVSAAAVGGVALVACGSDDKDSSSSTPEATNGQTAGQQPSASAESPTANGSATGGAAGKPLAKTSEIPVGGGKVFGSEKVVVTQPTAGTFKAFSATCTHQGCLVAEVADGNIDCKCHGSLFSVTDGSVTKGPATQPLPEKRIATSGDQISLLS